MSPNFKSLMAEATRLTRSGLLGEATISAKARAMRGSLSAEKRSAQTSSDRNERRINATITCFRSAVAMAPKPIS